jgi:CMP-2-keto-3-deoxyoctulosonic acid synthetase
MPVVAAAVQLLVVVRAVAVAVVTVVVELREPLEQQTPAVVAVVMEVEMAALGLSLSKYLTVLSQYSLVV